MGVVFEYCRETPFVEKGYPVLFAIFDDLYVVGARGGVSTGGEDRVVIVGKAVMFGVGSDVVLDERDLIFVALEIARVEVKVDCGSDKMIVE